MRRLHGTPVHPRQCVSGLILMGSTMSVSLVIWSAARRITLLAGIPLLPWWDLRPDSGPTARAEHSDLPSAPNSGQYLTTGASRSNTPLSAGTSATSAM